MTWFWVGVSGELAAEQRRQLAADGLTERGQLRESNRPGEFHVLRTYVSLQATDSTAAKARVAAALGMEPAELVAHPEGDIR